MHPAFSVISFTTLLGAAQGLVVALSVLTLAGASVPYLFGLLVLAVLLLIVSLGASFLHLGHPERAWRAAAMWRTSWLSREVIVLPIFIGLTALWALFEITGNRSNLLLIAIIVLSVLLWYCTAMIYACIKFIQEWAHGITVVNYFVLGIASGLVLLTAALAAAGAEMVLVQKIAIWAVVATLIGLATRWVALQRNASLKPKSTLQSATGIQNPVIQQKSMGMSAGAFNTREFFHGQTEFFVRNVKSLMLGLCFAAPVVLILLGTSLESRALLAIAFPIQYLGLLSERWLFFAQARHPQNIYYQTVS
jgi:sulfite dehydrogenase (quinone) subunit SoeC